MSKNWREFYYGIILGLVIGLAFIVSVQISGVFGPEPCSEVCAEGYKYLWCDSGVVQMMSGDGEEVYLVKCSNENHN